MIHDTQRDLKPPTLSAEPGWLPMEVPALYDPSNSFVSGDQDAERLRVRYFRTEGGRELLGKAWFGPHCEGPPGHAHGGSISAVMDEVMGGCAWMNGHTVLAARLSVNFRKPLPLGTEAWLRAWVDEVKGRKVLMRAVVTGAAGESTFAEADGLFIVLDHEQVKSADPRVRAMFERAKANGKVG